MFFISAMLGFSVVMLFSLLDSIILKLLLVFVFTFNMVFTLFLWKDEDKRKD
jgi:hypothetical protein